MRSGTGGRAVRRATIVAVVCALALWGVTAGSPAPRAAAAPLPGDWCGPAATATDLPDTVAGAQIHVVYAFPSDAPDRTATVAPRIARDLAGVDAWWQGQDPTRTPRFDLAEFPGCDSRFGALDITTLALRSPASAFALADATLANAVRTEIARTVGSRGTKADLVYLDAPVSAADGATVCGMAFADLAFVFLRQPPGCSPGGGLGSGDGWPARTAAHELTHLLTDGDLTGAPHVCPDDEGHICEPGVNDLLDTAAPAASASLSDAVLDPGRDDYYGHGQARPVDGRSSELLAHLDEPPQPVAVTIRPAGGGQVESIAPGLTCPAACTTAFDGHTSVRLLATAAPGYVFRGWRGDCTGAGPQCTVTTDAARAATARFDALVPYTVRVEGPGQVAGAGVVCTDRCTWDAAPRAEVVLTAEPSRDSRFTGWTGVCEGSRRHCRVTIGERARVTATFARS